MGESLNDALVPKKRLAAMAKLKPKAKVVVVKKVAQEEEE